MAMTLTERYVAATVRSLPHDQQEDVRTELSASITDDIDARVAQGEERVAAERAVLTALGDPDVLAAGYADRPLHLIGPRYYLTWLRLLKLLLVIVPVCGVGGVLIAKLIEGAEPLDAIGTMWAVLLGAIVHVAFWTTLVFAILERNGADTGVRWSLDQLPAEPLYRGVSRAEVIGSLVFLGAMGAAVLWDRFIGFVFTPEGRIPVLDPGLWPWWIMGLFGILALEAALAVAVFVRGGWNAAFATLNTLLAAAFSVPAVALLVNGALVNPELVAFVTRGVDQPAEVLRILTIVAGVAIVGVGVWDAIDGWLKTAREARRATR